MVGEFGVQERHTGDKADWILDAVQIIKAKFPRLRAVVYFDAKADYDWRMNTSPSAYAAFREMATDPWFSISATSRLTGP
jgi:hypothetical protein